MELSREPSFSFQQFDQNSFPTTCRRVNFSPTTVAEYVKSVNQLDQKPPQTPFSEFEPNSTPWLDDERTPYRPLKPSYPTQRESDRPPELLQSSGLFPPGSRAGFYDCSLSARAAVSEPHAGVSQCLTGHSYVSNSTAVERQAANSRRESLEKRARKELPGNFGFSFETLPTRDLQEIFDNNLQAPFASSINMLSDSRPSGMLEEDINETNFENNIHDHALAEASEVFSNDLPWIDFPEDLAEFVDADDLVRDLLGDPSDNNDAWQVGKPDGAKQQVVLDPKGQAVPTYCLGDKLVINYKGQRVRRGQRFRLQRIINVATHHIPKGAKQLYFIVKWEGYEVDLTCPEPLNNLRDTVAYAEFLEEFHVELFARYSGRELL